MRWDDQRVEAEAARALPGYREPAAIRTFDAPEALDTHFYEVRARSALNKVPAASRMPFRWTVNPHRGCTHACSYCLSAETPVLLADDRTRAIVDLEVGDRIYGTERRGEYRRYVETEVLAHWESVKPAFRVRLADGTELVASGDHRFLTRRGWKHVTGAEQGRHRRPHLTVGSRLMGVGRLESGPSQSREYRRGYLCGMVRGDGTIGSYAYQRPHRHRDVHHRFRLALVDDEALDRAQAYLADEDVATDRFQFQTATTEPRAAQAIRTSAGERVERIRELVRWPEIPSDDWRRGFLAGIFDAEGSCSGSVLRISNTNDETIEWIVSSLGRSGFDVILEDRALPNGLRAARVRGGLAERLRFFHLVDPAISRKRSQSGLALKGTADLRVDSIEPLGRDLPMFDITTGTGDFIANGVVSHNCFARPTHHYLDFDAGRDFEREIVVKVNVPEVLRAELGRPSWQREHVALGTNTDPYQWVESRYRLMPGIWEALRDAANPCSILTKSPLLLRDLPLLREIAARTEVTAALSVPTLDERAWRATEPHTPHPRKRLEAVAELNRAGIPTSVLVAPLMPGINDAPEQVERILTLAEEAGAVSVGGIALHLRGEVREVFMSWLRSARPDLVPRYEALYARGGYAPPAEQRRLAALLRRGRAPRDDGSRWGVRRDPEAGAERGRDRDSGQARLF